ncbi:MAG: exo-alpha-sialidase, partial [Chloroflexi bacterium]
MRFLKPMRMMALSTVLLVVMTIVATISSGLVHAASLVTVSGNPSPYTGCSTAGQPGTVSVNAEVEPWVSVNPANPKNIIGVWQQDRWNNGGAQGLVAGSSSNGGTTWSESTLPFSGCAPGAILDSTISGNNDTGVATVTSSDGGKTWGNGRLIKSDQGTSPIFEVSHFFNDKESITADPLHAGTAYVVWDRLVAPSHSPDAALHAHAFRGPSWFSKTTDGGKTWTGTRAIFDPGQNSQTIGNVVVVDPRTGVLYDFFELFQTTGSPNFTPRGLSVGFISSSYGGSTWSQPKVVSNQQTVDDFAP